jgi:quercetin dioxygenase-like cupin family protein
MKWFMRHAVVILIVVSISSMLTTAQEKAVPVEQEPLHKIVFKNDYVEVMHVTIQPGQSTMLHTHSHDSVAIRLSENTVRIDVPGKESSPALTAQVGSISTGDYAKQSFTHRVNNIGKTIFEVLDIELLKRPAGLKTAPIAASAAENGSLRAYKWTLAPGVSTPAHTHARPYLIIAATPMQLVMKAPDGSSMEHPIKAGDFHWIDNKVTHTLTNNGKESGILIEVELR